MWHQTPRIIALFFRPCRRHTQVAATAVSAIASVEPYATRKLAGGFQTVRNRYCKAMPATTAVSRLNVKPPMPYPIVFAVVI